MSRDAFLRLAFITLCSAYVAALVVSSRWLGWWTGGVAVLGLLFAVVLSEDWSQPVKPGPLEDITNGRRRERPSTDSEGKPRDFTRLRG